MLLRIWRWGGHPGLSRWALNAIASVFIRDRQTEIPHRHTPRREGHVKAEQRKVCRFWCRRVEWNDAATCQGMPAAPGMPGQTRQGADFPLEPLDTLLSAQKYRMWNSGFQKGQRRNCCCFKPLKCMTAATGNEYVMRVGSVLHWPRRDPLDTVDAALGGPSRGLCSSWCLRSLLPQRSWHITNFCCSCNLCAHGGVEGWVGEKISLLKASVRLFYLILQSAYSDANWSPLSYPTRAWVCNPISSKPALPFLIMLT